MGISKSSEMLNYHILIEKNIGYNLVCPVVILSMSNLLLRSTDVDRELLTPMMRQYMDVKMTYPNSIVLYRLGDFYEAFFEDAVLIAKELELVLTGKEAGKEIGRVAMAGIPFHALDRYVRQLLERGRSVAICEQMENASQAKGLVRREVTRVMTPGTVLEEEILAAKQHNFLCAIVSSNERWGLAAADISTGEFFTTQLQTNDQLVQELLRLQPAEVIYPIDVPSLSPEQSLPAWLPSQFCYTPFNQSAFALIPAKERIINRYKVRSLEGFGCEDLPLAIRAAGGILAYLAETQKNITIDLRPLFTYAVSDYLILDYQTRRNLEITHTVRDNTTTGALLWALDRTVTAMGGRMLKQWLLQPLKDITEITKRQDTIGELQQHLLRQKLRSLLEGVYDIERIAGRISSNTANARDLVALGLSLDRLSAIGEILQDCQTSYLTALKQVPQPLLDLADRIAHTLVDSPPISLTEGGLIRAGVNAELDRLRQQRQDDIKWLSDLEKTERERTNIPTLKVGFNKAFGYYISISRGKSNLAPPHYIRKQTLTNEERFITPELKEREARILQGESQLNELEYEIFVQLREVCRKEVELIRSIARSIAQVDVLSSLAEVSAKYNYCRPVLQEKGRMEIKEGRHPVVEQTLPAGFFVPNSIQIGEGNPDLIILTGPNMSGKSIFLRQTGLIQLMAQVGSFVPAQSAKLSICDRIFTRVGAVDDLATGQSTFMVEMNETANILNHAKDTSLVLLDEIGRGTSTFDGMAIAWSVSEYIATQIRSKTIFATHYHELNELALLLPNVANFQVAVKELEDEIIFLHQVQPGGADRSYGIEVGRLAGLPAPVISRAKEVLEKINANSHIAVGLRKID
jgi:DNA mismatch repair protein MutS